MGTVIPVVMVKAYVRAYDWHTREGNAATGECRRPFHGDLAVLRGVLPFRIVLRVWV